MQTLWKPTQNAYKPQALNRLVLLPNPLLWGKKALFFHPKSTGGTLVELVSFA